jgi:hypothetical protein
MSPRWCLRPQEPNTCMLPGAQSPFVGIGELICFVEQLLARWLLDAQLREISSLVPKSVISIILIFTSYRISCYNPIGKCAKLLPQHDQSSSSDGRVRPFISPSWSARVLRRISRRHKLCTCSLCRSNLHTSKEFERLQERRSLTSFIALCYRSTFFHARCSPM